MSDKFDRAVSPEEFKKTTEPDPEIRALREQNRRLVERIDELRLGEGQIQMICEEIKELVQVMEPPAPVLRSSASKKVESPCTAVLHLTDWHYGEYQDPNEIEGFGKFNRLVAKDRLFNQLLPRFLNWVEVKRSNYIVDDCVIPVTGDLISGDIHHELQVTNEIPSPVQAVEVGYILGNLIGLLAGKFASVRVEFITADNHSRLVSKPQAKEAGFNTYNFIVGSIVSERVKEIKNVQFDLYPMIQKIVKIENTSYLCTHGDSIQGWAGFPYYGIDRKAGKEAIRRMQKNLDELRFDKILLGHFHAPLVSPWWMIGGSLSGTSTYDHKYGRYSPPIQTAWMVHPKYGEFDWLGFRME